MTNSDMAQPIASHSTRGHVEERTRTTVRTRTFDWGWFPALTVVCALGILMVVGAYTESRFSEVDWILPLYWGGVMLMAGPIIVRLLLPKPSREERIALLLLLMTGLFLFKVLLSPNMFYLSDEFTHWRTTNEILVTGELFNRNPILPTSTYYPGLQNATTAIVSITGLSIFHGANLGLFFMQVILVLSIYLLLEKVSGSPWIASIGMFIYMANPNYIFYGQQFGYESLSLPVATLVLYLVALRSHRSKRIRPWLNTLIVFLIISIIPTHHMTSYALIAFFSLWTLAIILERTGALRLVDSFVRMVERILKWLGNLHPLVAGLLNQISLLDKTSDQYEHEKTDDIPSTGWLTILTAAWTIFWLVTMATLTIGYLAPVLGGAVTELLAFISGETGAKETFKSISGFEPPPWERYIAFGTVGLLVAVLPFGDLQAWRQYRRNIPALTLIAASLAYPVTLAMRLTEKGAETANRSSEFLFVALGFVLAVAIVELWLKRGPNIIRVGMATIYLVVVLMGGIITGQAWWARLPGSYVVGGDTRSLQPESIEAGFWAPEGMDYNNRVIADSLNYKTMASYGGQFLVRGTSWVVFSDKLGALEADDLWENQIDYIVIDERTTRFLPINGHYFESNEPGADRHEEPIPVERVRKFDQHPDIDRIFDSGNVLVFDVRDFRDNRLTDEQREDE